jgi:predicted Fe-Mo cluster-binding NifX family protein
MKIAISSTGPTADAALDERFGRCACFVIADSDGTVLGPIDNSSAAQGQGAGIQAARLVAEQGVSVVLTGRCGPNACDTLAAAGVSVLTGFSGTVRQALDRYAAVTKRPD